MATTKKPAQTTIPGTERKVDKVIRAAAQAYVEVRDDRMELSEQESDAKAKLMKAMKDREVTHYVDEDAEIEVTIMPVDETVKVKKWKPKPEPKGPSEGEDEDASAAAAEE